MYPDNSEVLSGLVMDHYIIEEEIGRGAMGVVYRARHVRLARAVAIKVMHHRLLDTPTMIERFEREARLAAKLAHKNLVGVLDVGELPDGRRTMVLELATGKSLATVMNEVGRMSEGRVIMLAKQICAGLAAAHDIGLVHRDLKPENVVIQLDGDEEVPRIIDFGIAIAQIGGDSTERLTARGVALGTPVYMAPEQALGEVVDHRCDLFALGVMMYELLCGKPPFDGDGVEVANANVSKPPPSFATRAPGLAIHPGLEQIVMRAIAKKPAERYASARDVREALERVASSAPHRFARGSTMPPVDAPRRGRLARSSLIPIDKPKKDD